MQHLDQVLERLAPNDLLMPVSRGSKHPMFSHKGNQWSRDKFQDFVNCCKEPFDVCVLLRDLCVIDVDSHEIAQQLEARFPELLTAPMETTRHGRHYWFKRSPLCDELGYFDGAAQIQPKIDFKTVCSTGTSGIIVVAPSVNKHFVREITETNLIEIPQNILEAVAVDKKTVKQIVFTCGGTMTHSTHLLKRMSYFDPFLDEDEIAFDSTICVPCSEAEFKALIDRDSDYLLSVLKLADQLGHRSLETLTRFLITKALKIYQSDSQMMAAQKSATMVEINAPIYKTSDPPHKDKYLFQDLSQCPDPAIEQATIDNFFTSPNISEAVVKLLHKHRGHLALVGGAVCGLLTGCEFSDHDLFIYDANTTQADAILADISNELKDTHIQSATRNAMTFVEDKDQGHVIQVIFRLQKSPKEVMESFDFSPAKVGAWIEQDGTPKIAAMEEFVVSVQQAAFQVVTDRWSNASIGRVMKYASRGFRPYLPGLDRHAMTPFTLNKIETRDGKFYLPTAKKNIETHTLLGLLYAETLVEQKKKPIDIVRMIRGQTSGYDVNNHPFKNCVLRFFWAIKTMMKKLITTQKPAPQIDWTINVTSVFSPSNPFINHLHDQSKYIVLAAKELGILKDMPVLCLPKPSQVFHVLLQKTSPKVLDYFEVNTLSTRPFLDIMYKSAQSQEDPTTIEEALERITALENQRRGMELAIEKAKYMFTSGFLLEACKETCSANILEGLKLVIDLPLEEAGSLLFQLIMRTLVELVPKNTRKQQRIIFRQKLNENKHHLVELYCNRGAHAMIKSVAAQIRH